MPSRYVVTCGAGRQFSIHDIHCDGGALRERRRTSMPQWIKPGLWGAVAGSVLTMIVGFSFGGWITSDTAARVGRQQADAAVVTALVPLCVAQSKADRTVMKKIEKLRALT